jgi:hypothetical protein
MGINLPPYHRRYVAHLGRFIPDNNKRLFYAMLFLDYSFVAQLQFSSSSTANRKAYKPVMFSLHSFFESTQKRFLSRPI